MAHCLDTHDRGEAQRGRTTPPRTHSNLWAGQRPGVLVPARHGSPVSCYKGYKFCQLFAKLISPPAPPGRRPLTHQLHSGGTSLVSSSRDFSDLYSWQEVHHTCCSRWELPRAPTMPGHPSQDLRKQIHTWMKATVTTISTA